MGGTSVRGRAPHHAVHIAFTAVLLVTMAAPALAQGDAAMTLLPRVRYFASPVADPIEPRFGVGLIVTNVLAEPGAERTPFILVDRDDAREDVQASAALGGTLPLLRLVNAPEGGVTVGVQAGVFARFRIELPSRDDLGQDWVVAMPIEAAWNQWSARLRVSHRSSHLGDEFVAATDAERIEFGGESIDGLAALRVGAATRIYAGGGWIFRSYTDDTRPLRMARRRDRYLIQLGADGQWDLGPHFNVSAGADWQSAERTDWDGGLSVAGGIGLRASGRALGLVLRYFDGLSSMGQFFVTPEKFWSLELTADF